MKYLRSTTMKSWSVKINGKAQIIPSMNSKEFLAVADGDYDTLRGLPVLRSLFTNGDIFVASEVPVGAVNALELTNQQLVAANKQAQSQIALLQKQVAGDKVSKKEYDMVKVESARKIAELQAKIAALEKGTKK